MSECDVQELMNEAGCFACLPPDQQDAIAIELLCRIMNNGGGGGGATPAGVTGDVQLNDNGALGVMSGFTALSGVVTTPALVVSDLTAGSVPFVGTAGRLSQDNANLFWDDTNKTFFVGNRVSGLGGLESFSRIVGNAYANGGNALLIAITGEASGIGAITLAFGGLFTASYNSPGNSCGTVNGLAGSATGTAGTINDLFGLNFQSRVGGATVTTCKGVEMIAGISAGSVTNISAATFEVQATGGTATNSYGFQVSSGSGGTITNRFGGLITLQHAAAKGLVIKTAATPTGNIFECRTSADAITTVIDSGANLVMGAGKTIQLGNNAVAETPTATHTCTFKDGTGTTYRLLCLV